MKRDDDKHSEKLVGWLANFADRIGEKVAKDNNIDLKNAGYMENILDIVNRNKKTSVEAKVEEYRRLVGLDLVDNIEKEGGKEVVASTSRMSLSIRDKVAQDQNGQDDGPKMDKIKQYIGEVIRNRNGSIATPAILDQLENYMKADKVDKEWLRKNLEHIEGLISNAREEFRPSQDNQISVNDLARTDDPSKGEKEQPPFLPPATSG